MLNTKPFETVVLRFKHGMLIADRLLIHVFSFELQFDMHMSVVKFLVISKDRIFSHDIINN